MVPGIPEYFWEFWSLILKSKRLQSDGNLETQTWVIDETQSQPAWIIVLI